MSAEPPRQAQNIAPHDKKGEAHNMPDAPDAESNMRKGESIAFEMEKEKMAHERHQRGQEMAHQRHQGKEEREHEYRMLGSMGQFLGGGNAGVGSIAFIVSMICLFFIACFVGVAVFLENGWEKVDAGVTALTGIMSICLGYHFGRK